MRPPEGDSGELLHLGGRRIVHPGPCEEARWLEGGVSLLTIGPRGAIVWDPASSVRRSEHLSVEWGVSWAVAPDGHRVVVVSDGATVEMCGPDWQVTPLPVENVDAVALTESGGYAIVDGERLVTLDTGDEILRLPEGYGDVLLRAVTGGLVAVRLGDARTATLLHLLDVEAGTIVKTWKSGKGPRNVVAVRAGGGLIGHKGGAGWKLWRVGARKPVKLGVRGQVWRWAASDDGERLAFSGKDGVVRLVATATGTLLQELRGPNDEPTQLAVSSCGRWVGASFRSEGVCIWCTDSGDEVPVHAGRRETLWDFVPDGSAVLCSEPSGDLLLRGLGDTVAKASFAGNYGHPHHPAFARYTTDGGVGAAVQRNPGPAVALFDAATGEERGGQQAHRCSPLVLTPTTDGRGLLSVSRLSLRVWSLDDGSLVSSHDARVALGHAHGAHDISDVALGEDGTVWLASVAVHALHGVTFSGLRGPTHLRWPGSHVGLSRHGVHVFTVPPPRGRARLFRLDPNSGEPVAELELDYMAIQAAAFTDGRIVTLSSSSRTLERIDVWDPLTGARVGGMHAPRPALWDVRGSDVSAESRWVATTIAPRNAPCRVTVFDAVGLEVQWDEEFADRSISALAFVGETLLAVGDDTGKLSLHEVVSGEEVGRIQLPGTVGVETLRAIDPSRVAIARADASLALWRFGSESLG